MQQDVRVNALENISRRYNVSINNLGRTIIAMLKEEAETNEKRRIAAGILKYTPPPPLKPLVDQFYVRYRPRNLDPLKKTVTVLIEMHGCDLPFPLFQHNPEARKKIPRIHMTSGVTHGCSFFKNLPFVLNTIDNVFRNETLSATQQVDEFSRVMANYWDRLISHEIPSDDLDRTKFIENIHTWFRQHPVIINREYTLDENVAGIYIVHSNQRQLERQLDNQLDSKLDSKLDIHFDYYRSVTEEIAAKKKIPIQHVPKSLAHLEKNNILSPHVSNELRNAHDYLTHLMKTKNRIRLEEIINVLFSIDDWSDIHVIDLGCRQTCDYAYPPELKRMASQDIIDLEFRKQFYQTEEELIEQERIERERLERELIERERLERERIEQEREQERIANVLGFQLINQYTGRWCRKKYNSKRRRVNKRRGTKRK